MEYGISVRVLGEGYADPVGAFLVEGAGNPRHISRYVIVRTALEIAAFNELSGFAVILLHQKGDIFFCPRMTENGKAGKVLQPVLWLDLIFVFCVCNELRQFHVSFS